MTTIKTCSCGARFIPPSAAQSASRCRRCHKAFRADQANAAKQAAEARARARAVAERVAEEAAMATALKEAYLHGGLPRSAKVRERGRQVVVVWQGRSQTFYLPAKAA